MSTFLSVEFEDEETAREFLEWYSTGGVISDYTAKQTWHIVSCVARP